MNHIRRLTVSLWLACVFCLATQNVMNADEQAAFRGYNPPELLANLENRHVSESSGLAISNRHPGVFWTHNDSGDEARLFAFDAQGKHRGVCRLRGAEADDWEDMGTFVLGEKSLFFVADVGDNPCERANYIIYIALEPASPNRDTLVAETIVFTYEDMRSHDCEAVALDVTRREFLLFEKQRIGFKQRQTRSVSNVWLLKWQPGRRRHRSIAKQIAAIDVPSIPVPLASDKFSFPFRISNAVTSLDISADGRRAVVATYATCIVFQRNPVESWRDALGSGGHEVQVPIPPARIQGESICFGSDGKTLYLTSEKKPCPLFIVPTLSAE